MTKPHFAGSSFETLSSEAGGIFGSIPGKVQLWPHAKLLLRQFKAQLSGRSKKTKKVD